MFPEEVETARLLLRKPIPSDAEDVFRTYAQDAEVTRYVRWVPHKTMDTTKAFVAACCAGWQDGNAFPYVIARKTDRVLMGMIELRPRDHHVEFGYVLARSHWGQGVMTEAAASLVRIALQQSSIYRVWATCDVDNKASARVMEKAGLLREGLLKRHIVHPNVSPQPRDSFIFALTK